MTQRPPRPVWDLTRWQKWCQWWRGFRCLALALTERQRAKVRNAGWWVGRRGAVLTVYGLIYLNFGVNYLFVAQTPYFRQSVAGALDLFPLAVWALMWLASGAICLWYALGRPPEHDRQGWFCAIVMPGVWACTYAIAALGNGVHRAWSGVGSFALFAAIGIICANWPNPARMPAVTEC